MSKLPFMRFWGADYMKDTRHLTFEEHGVYFHLLWFMWEEGGKLPDDDKIIARMLGVTVRKWQGYKGKLRQFFEFYGPDIERQFSQKRLIFEYNRAREISRLCVEKGSKGGTIKAKNIKEYQQTMSSRGSSRGSSPDPSRGPSPDPSRTLAGDLATHKERKNNLPSFLTAAREEESDVTGETQPPPDGACAPDGAAPPALNGKTAPSYLLETGYMRRAALKA